MALSFSCMTNLQQIYVHGGYMHEASSIHKDAIWLVYFLQKNFVEKSTKSNNAFLYIFGVATISTTFENSILMERTTRSMKNIL